MNGQDLQGMGIIMEVWLSEQEETGGIQVVTNPLFINKALEGMV
jgi:hypothetical protein